MYDLGLTSEQFWDLTMPELQALSERWIKQNEAEMYRAAFIAATIINVHRDPKRRPIKPQELLKPSEASEYISATPDEIRTMFKVLARQKK